MDKVIALKNGVVVKETDSGFEIISKNGSLIKLDDDGEFAFYERSSKVKTIDEKDSFLKNLSGLMNEVL